MPNKKLVTLHINGSTYEAAIRPYDVLLDVIRENLNLTGTKRGCDMGTCGCCTVHIDGRARLSCLTLALEAVGHEITTIEGLKCNGLLHPLQRAFAEHGGSQCGFCTQGFIMTAKAFLDEHAHPTREEIEQAISGNLCRCTGYIKIVEAIEAVARQKREIIAEASLAELDAIAESIEGRFDSAADIGQIREERANRL